MGRKVRPEVMENDLGVPPSKVPELPRVNPPAPRQELAYQDVRPERVAELMGRPMQAPVSPLRVYLQQNSLSEQSFARCLGVALLTIQNLTKGESVPTLAVAYEIERVTKGVIPMEAWLGIARAQEAVKAMREKQPEGVRGWNKPAVPTGTASSLEKRPNSRGEDELEKAGG